MNLGNKEIMARNISKYMDKFGIDRNKLSADLGISYTTITDWIKGKTYPRIDKIELLANYFGVSKSDLVEDSVSDISTIYNQLVPLRQEKVYNFAEEQLSEQKSKVVSLDEYKDHLISLQSKVSAGSGVLDLDPSNAWEVEYHGKLPKYYDVAFQVAGNSMEPLFADGDIVFVELMNEAINGALMVVQIDDEAFVKKVYVDDSNLRLVSLNKDYKDIRADSSNDIRIVGKVVF